MNAETAGVRENAAFADDNAAEAVRRGDLDHDLDRFAVKKRPSPPRTSVLP